jgi:hypothetical protein
MRKFLQKVGLRLLILLGIWVIFTQLLPKRLYLGAEYSRWETVFGKIEDLKQSKQRVNLVIGDSRPEMGLASKHLNAYNLGLGGTSPVEGFYMLLELRDVPIDTLYLSYSPFHFQSQDCFHTRSEYFGFISPDYLHSAEYLFSSGGDTVFHWNNWAWLDDLDKNFPAPWVQRQLRYLPAIRNLDNYLWYFREQPQMQQSMTDNQLSYLFPSDVCPSDTSVQEYYLEQKAGAFSAHPINEFYFDRILGLVSDRHIHLVWLNMPLNKAIRQPSQSYYDDFDRWLRPKLPTQTPYYPLGYQDACDFKDFSHLDEAAANAFGKKIAEWQRNFRE